MPKPPLLDTTRGLTPGHGPSGRVLVGAGIVLRA
jgi:hypothetical protein